MRALVQRVTRASVTVDGAVVGEIGHGLCALVGVTHSDTDPGAARTAVLTRHFQRVSAARETARGPFRSASTTTHRAAPSWARPALSGPH